MRLLKWLLLQMLQTRITCSKKEGDIAFFFCYNTQQKRSCWYHKRQQSIKMLPICCQGIFLLDTDFFQRISSTSFYPSYSQRTQISSVQWNNQT